MDYTINLIVVMIQGLCFVTNGNCNCDINISNSAVPPVSCNNTLRNQSPFSNNTQYSYKY